MGEQVLEDVALYIWAEFLEVDGVELVDDLLQDVRVDDLQNGVAEVLGDLRLVLHERRHVGKDLVAHKVAQLIPALEAPLRPAIALGLLGKRRAAVAPLAHEARLQLAVDSSSSRSLRKIR